MSAWKVVVSTILITLCCLPFAIAAEQTPSQPSFTTASGRTVFWRGEPVIFSLAAPLDNPAEVSISLANASGKAIPLFRGMVKPVDGTVYLHVLAPTANLGDGVYTATATYGNQRLTSKVTLRETTVPSPGMIIDETSCWVTPNSQLAGQTAAINFMTDGRLNFTGPSSSESPNALNAIFDRLTENQLLFWTQDASRPFSFIPPHSSPRTNGEYLRRMMLGNAVLMRYPSFAGQLFDYDHTGFNIENGTAIGMTTYWGWGNLRDALTSYLGEQETALIENYRKQTGLEPLTGEESAKLSAALGIPEGMGYIDLPTRRWAYQVAARTPKLEAVQLASLKKRANSWYAYLMTLNHQRYTEYTGALRTLDPTLMHSTSNTINHSQPRQGNYHPLSYEPLDFRFVAVWDDQGGAPEHIYETVLAATLLNGNRSPNQPLWVNTVFGWQNGNIFRNAMQVVGRGGQGTGYAMEMGANMGVHYDNILRENAPMNQELALNGKLMERFGGIFTNTQHTTRLGLLYSRQQITITPYAQSYCDGMFKVLYLLAHVGMPPSLVTEETLANKVPDSMDTIIVLGQTEALPEAALKGLRAFAARGGRVIADSATTMPWEFLERSEALDVPFRDFGHPYNMATAYNRQDATIGVMRELAAERCPKLRALLQPSIANVPLDATDTDVAVCTLQGGAATFVTAANDSALDLSRMFTNEQQLMTSYQQLFVSHGIGANASWMPLRTNLLLSPRYGDNTTVYDLFTMTSLAPVRKGGGRLIPCDLTGISARLFAIYPTRVGAGRLTALQAASAGETIDLRYQATDAARAPLAAVVPVEITLLNPDGTTKDTLYRATDAKGVLNESMPTGCFDAAGTYIVQVRQLLDGQGLRLPVVMKAGQTLKATQVNGATVRDPQSIRTFLANKPEIVVPLYDPAMQPYVEKVVAGLQRQGVKAREWDAPPMVEYGIGYEVSEQGRQTNAIVDRGEAIGTVPFVNMVHHVNGNFYGSAMTGFRYGKHILLLGIPGTNKVLQGVKGSGLLWSDQTTDTPGGALVQRIPWALGQQAETIVVQGADLAGLEAGVNALLNLPKSDQVTDGVRQARANMFHQRALPLTYRVPVSTKKLTEDKLAVLPAKADAPRFSLTGVVDVQEQNGTLVTTLSRYGNTVALVDGTGKVTAVPAISSKDQTYCGKSIIVTATPEMTFAWSPEGKPLWRAMGNYQAILPGTDDVLVEREGAKFRVSPDGSSVPYTEALPAVEQPKPIFSTNIVTVKADNTEQVKEILLTDTRSGLQIDGFRLTANKPYNAPWVVDQTLAEGASGNTLLVFKRYAGERTAQVYSKATGKVTDISLNTAYLTDAVLSHDEKQVAVSGCEGDVAITDVNGKVIARAKTGAYPHIFALRDGGFAIGSADGLLTVLDSAGKERFTRDLVALTAGANPEDAYHTARTTKLLTWSNPPVAGGALPLDRFYWYLRDETGALRMVNQPPSGALDFRWMDCAQGALNIPEGRTYTVTIHAAAKYFDQEPLTQSSWASIVALRNKVVTNERPAPAFRLYLDGKPVATLTPEGGALKPFVTQAVKEGWAILRPKDEELTTFTTAIDLPAGNHLFGIEAVNMEDCYTKTVEVK